MYTFTQLIEKYWNYLPKQTRSLKYGPFKEKLKEIVMDERKQRHRQNLLNFGRDTNVMGAPHGINEWCNYNENTHTTNHGHICAQEFQWNYQHACAPWRGKIKAHDAQQQKRANAPWRPKNKRHLSQPQPQSAPKSWENVKTKYWDSPTQNNTRSTKK